MEILLFLFICNFHYSKIQFHGNKTRSHVVQNSTLVKKIQILHVSIIVYHTSYKLLYITHLQHQNVWHTMSKFCCYTLLYKTLCESAIFMSFTLESEKPTNS